MFAVATYIRRLRKNAALIFFFMLMLLFPIALLWIAFWRACRGSWA